MSDIGKFWTAVRILKSNVECNVKDNILTEDDFNNNIEWVTGATENGSAITTTTCPHSEITWTALKTEMDIL